MSPVSNVDFSLCRSGEAQGSHDGLMTRDTRIALFLIGELVAALGPDTLTCLSVGCLNGRCNVVTSSRSTALLRRSQRQ